MPKCSSKKRPDDDPNVIAFDVVQQATWEDDGGDGNRDVQPTRDEEPEFQERPEKNPAAVALGRLGGLKGGKARAKALSSERKREIAKKAAKVRWDKARSSG